MAGQEQPPPEPAIAVDSKDLTGDPPRPARPLKPQKPVSKWRLALGGAFLLGLSILAFRLLWVGFETGVVAVPTRRGHDSVSFGDRPAAFILLMAFWSLFPLFWVSILTSREVRRRFVSMWREAP